MDDRFSPRSPQSDETLAQTLHDPMFEPQSSFAEPSEDQRALHQIVDSPQGPNQQSFSSPINGTSFDPDFSFGENDMQFTQDLGPFGQTFKFGNFWQDHKTFVDDKGGTFPNPKPMQRILQNRRSLKQQFGQKPPPDDEVGECTLRPIPAESAVSEAAERAKSDKSECARNAANHRHAKTKKMRKDSQPSNPGAGNSEKTTNDKKHREKNRLAAAKCRAKKNENIGVIEVKHRELSTMHSSLEKLVQDLRGELTGLRTP